MSKKKKSISGDFRRWDNILILNPRVECSKVCVICEGDINPEKALELVMGNDLEMRFAICEECAQKHADGLMEALRYTDRINFAVDMEHLMGLVYEILRVRVESED